MEKYRVSLNEGCFIAALQGSREKGHYLAYISHLQYMICISLTGCNLFNDGVELNTKYCFPKSEWITPYN